MDDQMENKQKNVQIKAKGRPSAQIEAEGRQWDT
jgi:hypothetical protein